jgi:hypothetical protein
MTGVNRTGAPTRWWWARPRTRSRVRAVIAIEQLESRTLLSGSSKGLHLLGARPAHESRVLPGSRNPAIFTSLMGLLQARATNGPLAALAGGKVGGSAFVAKLSNLISAFDRGAARFLKPVAPRLIRLVDLQGDALAATENQWNQRRLAGLYTGSNATYFYVKDATTTIRQLTLSRPLWPMGTPNLSLYQRADTLAHNLEFDVVNPLESQNPPSPATAKAVGLAEAKAFQADFDATLTARPFLRFLADAAASSLKKNLSVIGRPGINPASQAQVAQLQFATSMFAGQGLFGPQGPLSAVFTAPVNPFPYNQYYRLYTFGGAQVTASVLTQATTYYRTFSDPVTNVPPVVENNYKGAYLSTQDTFASSVAIQQLALDQSWYHPNLATMKVNVTVPAGTTIYIGTVAPIYQGVYSPELIPSLYPGGANQTVVLSRNTTYSDPRPISAQP